jgi:hypothetical protein
VKPRLEKGAVGYPSAGFRATESAVATGAMHHFIGHSRAVDCVRLKLTVPPAWLLFAACSLLPVSAGCAGPRSADLDSFDQESPAPELGRPGWVRIPARIGAYLGGFAGLIVSVVALPVTFPISLIADESLGQARTEFVLFPAYTMAGSGHFLLGGPFDLVHWIAWRAWVDAPQPSSYEQVGGPSSRPASVPAPTSMPSTGSPDSRSGE